MFHACSQMLCDIHCLRLFHVVSIVWQRLYFMCCAYLVLVLRFHCFLNSSYDCYEAFLFVRLATCWHLICWSSTQLIKMEGARSPCVFTRLCLVDGLLGVVRVLPSFPMPRYIARWLARNMLCHILEAGNHATNLKA